LVLRYARLFLALRPDPRYPPRTTESVFFAFFTPRYALYARAETPIPGTDAAALAH
jgi:hypothetical protein